MGWEFVVLPIIAVAVWIIGTLIRSAEKAQGPDAARPGQRPERVTDLDRFLREIHRRRQTEQRTEGRPEPPPVRRPPPEELPVVRPVAEVVPVQPVVAVPVLRVIEAPALPDAAPDSPNRPAPQRPEPAAPAPLRRLLRSRDGLRAAVILQEVLGPPVSRRRR